MKTKTKFVFDEEEAKVVWEVFGNVESHNISKAVGSNVKEEIIADRIFEQLDEVFSKK